MKFQFAQNTLPKLTIGPLQEGWRRAPVAEKAAKMLSNHIASIKPFSEVSDR